VRVRFILIWERYLSGLMYPLGHFALGYFTAILSRKYTPTKLNVILIWIFSVLPDFDILIPGIFHRGPTHSIITGLVVSSILLLLYRNGIPYCIALLSHSILGDYFTSYGCQLFWPLNTIWYRFPYALKINMYEYALELILFLIMLFVLRIHLKKYG